MIFLYVIIQSRERLCFSIILDYFRRFSMSGGILAFIIHLPEMLFQMCVGIDSVSKCKEIAEKPFICPNCGGEFHVKWKRLWFSCHPIDGDFSNKAVLKCPHCKERDACRWTGADRI